MDTISNYLKTPLAWEFKKKKALLKSNDKTILELKTGKKRASFKTDDKSYTIYNKGFWNPATIIEEDKKSIARLNRYFRSKSTWVEFSDGNKYLIRCKNLTFIKLSICSADHKEIIRYKLISKYKASLSVYDPGILETGLMILLALGCFIFRGIIRENKIADLESVVFSNAISQTETAAPEIV